MSVSENERQVRHVRCRGCRNLRCAGGAAAHPCIHDRAAALALDYAGFDKPDAAWRKIAKDDRCLTVAADLIAAYRSRHRSGLGAYGVSQLSWHEGQLRASAGDAKRAIPLLEAGTDDELGNHLYSEATIAFLRKDRPALLKARAAYAALPEPEDFAKAQERFRQKYPWAGPLPAWPPNLQVIDGLIACFGKPYKVAYGECRPAAAPAPASQPVKPLSR